MSWYDFYYDKHAYLMKPLDIFIGLTETGFHKYEKRKQVEFVNPMLQRIHDHFSQGQEVLENMICLEIPDGHVDNKVYKIALDLLSENKKIGFGCVAGHGRTGWLLAKLIMEIEEVDADEAVRRTRERLCYKCVETEAQIKELGCVDELGWYEIRELNEAVKKQNQRKLFYGNDVVVIEDEEDELDIVEKHQRNLDNAWNKHNAGHELTEEEEKLIIEDISRSVG
jgi:hypothetical protein